MRTLHPLALLAGTSLLAGASAAQTAPENAVPGGAHPAGAFVQPPVLGSGGPCSDILVYDDNTQHGLGATAAGLVGTVTIGGSANFDTLLGSQAWDIVVVDCPSNIPSSGWGALQAYVGGGGKCVMSYWDWDAFPALAAAFGVTVTSDFSTVGQTLQDSGSIPSMFTGVTMPNSDWHNHWGDDGDNFDPGAGVGFANLAGSSDPCMVLGNGGDTIAAFVLDDSGDTWLGDGSAVRLWQNMIEHVCVGGSPGTNYCTSVPNSTGGAAVMSGSGSGSIAGADLVLTAATVPNQPGIFFHGPTQIMLPFGNGGFLCTGGGIVRSAPVVASGQTGTITYDNDVAFPAYSGTTRNFQYWFRDPAAGGDFFNTSDGYAVAITP